jgi:hypothetical protein
MWIDRGAVVGAATIALAVVVAVSEFAPRSRSPTERG